MALDWNKLDSISSDMARKVEQAYEEIIDAIMLEAKGMTAQETAILVNNANMEALMTAKLTNVFAEYQAGVINILENTLYEGQPIINILNMAPGDKKVKIKRKQELD